VILAVFLVLLLATAYYAPAAQPGQAKKTGGTELTIWVDSGNQLPVRMALVTFQYMRDQMGQVSGYDFQGVTWNLVDKSYLTPEQFRQELLGELEQGGGPDLVFMDGANGVDLRFLMEEGKLLGLEESVARSFLSYDDIMHLDGTLEPGQMDGTQYVLPLYVQCPVVFGLKDVLEEAGLGPEGGYGTLEEFLEAALGAAESSGKQVFEDASAVDWLERYAMPQSLEGEKTDGTGRLEELLARVRERSGSRTGFFDPYESLESGESLLSGCGLGWKSKLVQNIALLGSDETVLMAVPAWDGEVRAVVTQAAAVNANTAHPKEAVALLQTFLDSLPNDGFVQQDYPAVAADLYWQWQITHKPALPGGVGKPEYADRSKSISASGPAGRSFLASARDAVTDAVYRTPDQGPESGSGTDVEKRDVLTVGVCDMGTGSLHPVYRWLSDVAGRYSDDGLYVQIISLSQSEIDLTLRQHDMEKAGVGFDVILVSAKAHGKGSAPGLDDISADLTPYLGENSGGYEVVELSGKPKGLVYGTGKTEGAEDVRYSIVISDKCPRKEEAFGFCAAALKDEGYEQAVKEAGYEPVGMD